jgi:hypothetical protein
MGALDLLFKAGAKGAKKAAPFFSKADVVLDELQRNKGTGDEFLTEIVKKGAKPTELKERGIEKALKGKPKMTKAEVQKVFQQKAPPKVQEKVLTDVPDYDEWLEAKAQEEYGVDYFDLNKDEKKKLDKMYGDLPATKYEQYKTPGGENYREILLKLPAFDNKRLMELEADIRRSESVYRDPMSMPDFRAKLEELEHSRPSRLRLVRPTFRATTAKIPTCWPTSECRTSSVPPTQSSKPRRLGNVSPPAWASPTPRIWAAGQLA